MSGNQIRGARGDSSARTAPTPTSANETSARTPKIALHIGEALIDIVVAGGTQNDFVGGSPANAAMGVARLGHTSRLLTSIGRDERGERISDLLSAEAVELLPGSWNAPQTSTALARIAADGSASYTFDLTWEIAAADLGEADLVHAGSIGLFLEPGGSDVLATLIDRAGSALITVDPNIRPALTGDHGAALRRFEAAASVADLVKLSDEDAEWLYPGLAPDLVAQHVCALGARVTCVTLGAEGALAATAAGVTRVAAVPVQVADTISAGDSFMASLIASLLELGLDGVEQTLPEVLTRAAHAAAIAVSQPGANPPHRAALDAAVGA